jgi:hypothetical protein
MLVSAASIPSCGVTACLFRSVMLATNKTLYTGTSNFGRQACDTVQAAVLQILPMACRSAAADAYGLLDTALHILTSTHLHLL